MADGNEPSNTELAWRLARLQDTADNLVGRLEYAADKTGTDRRIDGLERRLDETRTSGFARMREIEQRLDDRAKEVDARFDKHEEAHQASSLNWRTLLWTGLLPAFATIIAVFLTVYLTRH